MGVLVAAKGRLERQMNLMTDRAKAAVRAGEDPRGYMDGIAEAVPRLLKEELTALNPAAAIALGAWAEEEAKRRIAELGAVAAGGGR